MGLLDIFRERKEKRMRDEAKGEYGDIKRFGVEILADEKLLARLESYEELYETIQDVNTKMDLDDIEDQTKKINTILHQVAIPWGRGGSSQLYGEAMSGWSTLYTRMIDIIGSSRNLIESQNRAMMEAMTRSREVAVRRFDKPSERFDRPRGYGDLAALSDTRGIVNKVWNFYNNIYTKYALMVAELSWFEEDVRPSWSGVIMPMPQFPGRTPTTLSPGMSKSLDAEMRGQG